MKQKQSGFSLVEAMIGLAIAGGVGLVLMQQQETSSKMQAKSNANQVVASAAQVVQTALADRAVCSMSLKDKKAGDSVPALMDAIVDPNDYKSFIATGKVHAAVNEPLPGNVVISKMKIVTDANNGKDYLEVEFNSNASGNKKMLGSNIVSKKFQIQGKKDASGKYLNCHSELSNLVKSSCEAIVGAVWNNNTCDLTNVVKKSDLVPIYANTLGMLSTTPPQIRKGEVTCVKIELRVYVITGSV